MAYITQMKGVEECGKSCSNWPISSQCYGGMAGEHVSDVNYRRAGNETLLAVEPRWSLFTSRRQPWKSN